MTPPPTEILIDRHVTYSVEIDGNFFVVQNVPARVNVKTGEQLFAPETVERLHKIIAGQSKPVRVIQTPVFEFAA